jgi:hypothetical protein
MAFVSSRELMKEFALYIDDSGSPKPNPNDQAPFFAVGGVLIRRSDQSQIQEALESFKRRWGISLETPLHGNEIRSRKKSFAWLGGLPPSEQDRFHSDLTQVITACPMLVHACVISRTGYCNRYLAQYGTQTWKMMKTAFIILLERTAKFVARRNGKAMIYYEKIGKTEDKQIDSYFHELRTNGHPFDVGRAQKYNPLPQEELRTRLTGIEGKTKNNPIMQLSDVCLFPVSWQKTKPENRALLAMHRSSMLVDYHLPAEAIASEGIKYSCFEYEQINQKPPEGG